MVVAEAVAVAVAAVLRPTRGPGIKRSRTIKTGNGKATNSGAYLLGGGGGARRSRDDENHHRQIRFLEHELSFKVSGVLESRGFAAEITTCWFCLSALTRVSSAHPS